MTEAVLPTATTPSRATYYGTWFLRIILAALFLSGALMKLTGQPMMVANFDAVGLGQWFRYFTAVLELIAAITVVIPRISVFGAILMLLIDLGALVAQVAILHIDWIHVVVIAAVIGLLIYLQRSKLAFR